MFTGIVEGTGRVVEVRRRPGARTIWVDAKALAGRRPRIGASVAVDGVCLTVVATRGSRLAFDVITETLDRTTLGDRDPGSLVNLERPVRADGRLDGHIVTGHVDARGRVAKVVEEPGQTVLWVATRPSLTDPMVVKGSVGLNGVSLTLTAVQRGRLAVALIPHTLDLTNLGDLAAGDAVNVEVDCLAKLVARLLGPYLSRLA